MGKTSPVYRESDRTGRIRPVTLDDARVIAGIYNPYIADTVITFEEQPVKATEMARRIAAVIPRLPWLLLEQDGRVMGYAYASPWRERTAYRHSVETTIYLESRFAGQGMGKRLYDALLQDLRKMGLHTAFGVISLPNPASVALHEKCGFTKVGHLAEAGWKFGRWVDVGYWQLMF
ncbi:MAG: phosphinothricin acetyltransferase [Gammaproteobacteria bacterium RIFCSPLOWO2_02_FULL_61_13]|nr:MAG: phosphinothricin acetyltransferase [Gammaproteobacteria bacterium RIFCSPLOWO2_02_FULL_61_13]